MTLTVSTQKGYLQAISGMFSTKEQPGGLTPKEQEVLVAILFVIGSDGLVTKETKAKTASLLNHPAQVITNYVKRLRDKGAITKDNKVHKLLQSGEVTIKYKKQSQDNL